MASTDRTRRRVAALIAIVGALAGQVPAFAGEAAIEAPNVVPISARLVTSGQPTAAALSRLAAQGFGAVIDLAPLSAADAVPGEADIVRQQGLEFVSIPIAFGTPTQGDFQAFVAAMNRLGERKVLVHCQANMRASSMTFLYRVIVGHERPEQAYEAVVHVWTPAGPWRRLLDEQLQQAGIAFELY
jgi:protein tyrosine phosphatase (PTP) superfamily phosphohydrolase (DUF442 family)